MNKQNSHLSKFYRNFLKYSLLKIHDNAMCHVNESENQFYFSHLPIFYRTNITLEKSSSCFKVALFCENLELLLFLKSTYYTMSYTNKKCNL